MSIRAITKEESKVIKATYDALGNLSFLGKMYPDSWHTLHEGFRDEVYDEVRAILSDMEQIPQKEGE